MNKYVKLEFWNDCDLHGTLYSAGLHNQLYVDGDAARAEYLVEEEGTQSDNGTFTPDLQKWTKRVFIDFAAPEFLLDALHYGQFCDNFYYYDKFGGVHECTDIQVEHDFIDGDCLAICTLSFTIDKITKLLCANMTLGSDV